MLCGKERPLTAGERTTLTFPVSCTDPVLLDRLGVLLSATGEPQSAVVYLDRVDWSGAPDYRIDLTRPDAMTGWGYLRGRWFARGGALTASHYGRDAEAYTGLLAWTDYRYEVRLRPHCGSRHRILFRVRGAQRSYALSLAPNGRVALEKNWQGYREVASVPFEWRLQQEYRLAVQVVGNRIQAFVDDQPMLEWRDVDRPWESGCVGLGVRNGRTLYIDASLRPPS
jgi:hypothetical protein